MLETFTSQGQGILALTLTPSPVIRQIRAIQPPSRRPHCKSLQNENPECRLKVIQYRGNESEAAFGEDSVPRKLENNVVVRLTHFEKAKLEQQQQAARMDPPQRHNFVTLSLERSLRRALTELAAEARRCCFHVERNSGV